MILSLLFLTIGTVKLPSLEWAAAMSEHEVPNVIRNLGSLMQLVGAGLLLGTRTTIPGVLLLATGTYGTLLTYWILGHPFPVGFASFVFTFLGLLAWDRFHKVRHSRRFLFAIDEFAERELAA